jgi:hypothetical protein
VFISGDWRYLDRRPGVRIYSRALMVYLRAASCRYKYKIRGDRGKKVADICRYGHIENVGWYPNAEGEEQYRQLQRFL